MWSDRLEGVVEKPLICHFEINEMRQGPELCVCQQYLTQSSSEQFRQNSSLITRTFLVNNVVEDTTQR
jgi:hypothetical protein